MAQGSSSAASPAGPPVRRRSPLSAVCAGLALGALLPSGGCTRSSNAQPEPPRYNIILIVVDTLRADHLGCYGYFRDTSPNIDAFADEAIFFENAYAPMAVTLPAHVSLFTGLYPLEHGTEANVHRHGGKPFWSRPGARSFAELARAHGYLTAGFVSATPLKRAYGLHVGFDHYEQPARLQRKARVTTDAALTWLREQVREPFFLFVHYFDPHTPYRPPPSYRRMFTTDAQLEAYLAERRVPAEVPPGPCRGQYPTITRSAVNLYDGEVRYADAEVGRLLDALRQRGLWERSVIIFTADHGEGLNQHDWPQHGRVWHEQVHVPLLIRFPRPRPDLPKRFAPVVSLIDVLPTVAAQLRLPWAAEFLRQARGVDVFSPEFRERPVLCQRSARDCQGQGGPLFALTTRQWRYFYDDGTEMLFNRGSDPHELENLADRRPGQAESLRRQLLELVATLRQHRAALRSDEAATVRLDQQLRREMEALGYIDTAAADPNSPAAGRPASEPAAPHGGGRP